MFPLPLTPMEAIPGGRHSGRLSDDGRHRAAIRRRAGSRTFSSSALAAALTAQSAVSLRLWARSRSWAWCGCRPIEMPPRRLGSAGRRRWASVTTRRSTLTKQIGLRIWVRQERTARRCCCTFIMPVPTRWEPLLSWKTCWRLCFVCPGGRRSLAPARSRPCCGGAGWHQSGSESGINRSSTCSSEPRRAAVFSPSPHAHGRRSAVLRTHDSPARDAHSGAGTGGHGPIAARGERGGVTVNDLLLCDLFATLRRWNVEHGQPKGGAGCGF